MLRAQKILVATDLSASADEAIRQADAVARASGGELVACHVLPEALRYQPLFPHRGADDVKALVAAEGRMGEAVADRVAEITGRAREAFAVAITHGAAGSGVVLEAEARGADLVVVGSRGATGLERFLLGSVAERVVRHAHCPVLVARSSPASGIVLGATDFSDPSNEAVDSAAIVARWVGARLDLLHAVDVTPPIVVGMTAPLGATWVPVPDEEVATMRETAREILDDTHVRLGVRGASHVVLGRPPQAIVEKARELPAQLVVAGTRGRTGLARLTLGSVAEGVVRDAPCSVLVVRTKPA
jgi:nucleotide-binding universal stress UspA family protein